MDILHIILDSIKDGKYDLVGMILLVSISIWFYNEFRKSYIANKSENKLDMEKALEQYSRLYFGIIAFQSKDISYIDLFEYINQAIPYLPRKITKKILELDKENLDLNSSKIENVKEIVKYEINSLKSKQYTITTFDSDDTMFDKIAWYISQNDFISIFNPLVPAFLSLIVTLLLLIPIGYNFSLFKTIEYVIIILNFEFAIMSLIYIIDCSFNKSLKVKDYFYFAFLVVLPMIIFIFKLRFRYSIISTFTMLIFLNIRSKHNRKN